MVEIHDNISLKHAVLWAKKTRSDLYIIVAMDSIDCPEQPQEESQEPVVVFGVPGQTSYTYLETTIDQNWPK
jgi:hypothetical protein